VGAVLIAFFQYIQIKTLLASVFARRHWSTWILILATCVTTLLYAVKPTDNPDTPLSRTGYPLDRRISGCARAGKPGAALRFQLQLVHAQCFVQFFIFWIAIVPSRSLISVSGSAALLPERIPKSANWRRSPESDRQSGIVHLASDT
jgi:hypothetical protein